MLIYYLYNLVLLNVSAHNIKAEFVIVFCCCCFFFFCFFFFFFFFFFFCLLVWFVCCCCCCCFFFLYFFFFFFFFFFFLLLLLLLFMIVVPWLQKIRMDIHDVDKSTSRLFCYMIKYPFSRYKYYDTLTCTLF